MRLWGSMAVLLAAALIAGCGGNNSQSAGFPGKATNGNATAGASPRNTPPDNIRRVTIAELRDMLEQNKAAVIDVRGTDAYKQERIKGALDIPENQLSSRTNELPKDKLLVFYCS